MISYETRRHFFNTIVAKYKDYLTLYAFLNNGSTEGCVDFGDFYWEQLYHSIHNVEIKLNRGY
ncbi:MAG: hypothetical protein WCI18_00915 [Pseudomonadota bacterium]